MSQERIQQVHEDEVHDHDRGLGFDLSTLMSRRRALQLFAIGGVATLVGCGGSSENASNDTQAGSSAASTSDDGGSTTASVAEATEIPEETGGPYPADGSNGVNVLTESGIIRRDITSGFGSATGTAEGVPLTIDLAILDVSAGGAPLPGASVYLWHCSREGLYSLYSEGVVDQNYLRGVQEADADGKVTFASIFPGAYSGRWPHIHFEVYPSIDEATSAGSKLTTSQIALPEDVCNLVYATAGYEQSVQNLPQTSLDTDNVFSDGYSTQLATATGTLDEGITINLNVGV